MKGKYIFILLFAGLILRLLLYKIGTYYLDVNTFIYWSRELVEKGLGQFYIDNWSDYLPGYLYVLWFLAKVAKAVTINEILLYKLPAILSDILTGYLIYSIVSKYKGKGLGLVSSAFYILNPAIVYNSSLWGQVDSLVALFSLLAIYLFDKYPFISAIALSFGFAVKPQVALAGFVVGIMMLKNRWKLSKMVTYGLISLVSFMVLFIPFSGEKALFPFIIERVAITLNQYPYISVNAFNFWGLFGFWKPDSGWVIPERYLGLFLFAVFSLIGVIKTWKKEGGQYLLAAILFTANFLFFTRMHERHLLPALSPLVIAGAVSSPVFWISYLGFSTTYVYNMYYAFVSITKNYEVAFPSISIKLAILGNMVLFGLLFIGERLRKAKSKFLDSTFSFPEISFSAKRVKITLFLILLFAFVSRMLFLQHPPEEYFDEVYHAFTARRMLNSDPKAWEWWNTPPEGFAYEWTHPPLAKLGMVLGMSVFGENSFGWRISGAALGVGVVFLVYLIAKGLFKDEVIALLSSAIFSFDGLSLVMARIGMNDTYLLFFVLLAIYFFIKKKNLLSALSFGLAISSKWSAIWVIPILAVLHFVLKRKIKLSHLWFLLIPPLVYLASYIPMFASGHNWGNFIEVQKQMWWYHTNLKATHPYTSLWWSWPFTVRPVYLYTSDEVSGFVSRIYAMGNPAVFWFGFASILTSAFYAFAQKDKKIGWIVFSYLAFFVPWALSPRIMFLYHYLPSIPFLAIATAYVLRRYPKLIFPALLSFLILFIYFYPHWSGVYIPVSLDKSYYWFPSWR